MIVEPKPVQKKIAVELENGKATGRIVGHASVMITVDRYGRLFPGSEDEAAGLLDGYLARAVLGADLRP